MCKRLLVLYFKGGTENQQVGPSHNTVLTTTQRGVLDEWIKEIKAFENKVLKMFKVVIKLEYIPNVFVFMKRAI